MEPNFYKKELKYPCISFISKEGKEIFKESLNEN